MSKIKTEKQTTWTKFWSWYERHVTESLILTAFIIYIQIPHMVWNADLYLESGMISRVHPILDFFMYGVDLIEIFPMVNIGFLIYCTVRKKRKQSIEIQSKKINFLFLCHCLKCSFKQGQDSIPVPFC